MHFDALYPFYVLDIRLRWLESVKCSPFHHPLVFAWLKHLLKNDNQAVAAPPFFLDLPECSRIAYKAGDEYQFRLILVRPTAEFLHFLFNKLQALPASAKPLEDKAAFRNNMELVSITDALSLAPADEQGLAHKKNPTHNAATLSALTPDSLAPLRSQLRESLRASNGCLFRFTAPTRLLKPFKQREQSKGENRFARDAKDITPELLLERMYTGMATLLGDFIPPPRPKMPNLPACDTSNTHWFWLNNDYKNRSGGSKHCGGMFGECHLHIPIIEDLWLDVILLSQLLGMGQNRHFGLGRFQLLDANQQHIQVPAPLPAATPWLQVIQEQNYLTLALEKSDARANTDTQALKKQLHAIALGTYKPPMLQGNVLLKPGKAPRPLAVPPFSDRILQRVIQQAIQPSIDSLMYEKSHGYRPNRSRLNALMDIRQAKREGYHWVFESDIDGFFDTVDREHIKKRLLGLFGEPEFVNTIINWLAAPVTYQGHAVNRDNGIPQGSPLSPLVANLILDDFDNDLKAQGLRLIRFADDFIVMCKSKEQAEYALKVATESLQEHDLQLNQRKTAIKSLDQGFHFLGYLIVGELALNAKAPKSKQKTGIPPKSWLAAMPESIQLKALASNTVEDNTKHSRSTRPVSSFPTLPNQTDDPDHLPIEQTTHPIAAHSQVVTSVEAIKEETNTEYSEEQDNPASSDSATQANFKDWLATQTDDIEPAHLPFGERQHLGTLICVNGDACTIHSYQQRLTITRDDEQIINQPFTAISGLVLFGHHQITSQCLHQLMQANVPVHYASSMGRYIGASVTPMLQSNTHKLWQQQVMLSDAQKLLISRQLVECRIRNMQEVLRRHECPTLSLNTNALSPLIQAALSSANLNILRGYEGAATQQFFASFTTLLPEWTQFTTRQRRPPPDPVNAMLSLGYTLLYGYSDTLLRTTGLLPWLGVFHQPRGTHAALASDLMEPFRHLVERTVLTLLRRNQITEAHFTQGKNEAGKTTCHLTSEGRKHFFSQLLNTMETPITAWQQTAAQSPSQALYQQANSLVKYCHQQGDFVPWRVR